MHCDDTHQTTLHHVWIPPRSQADVALVFLHGIAGSTAAWGLPFRQLNAKAGLLLLDCLGFGESPKPVSDYTPQIHVQALRTTTTQVLAQHKIRRLVLIGHSMGALLAAHWALSETKEADGLSIAAAVLISTPVFNDEEEAIALIGQHSWFDRWMSLETPLARATCWLMCRLRPWLMPWMPRLLPSLPPQVARDSLKHSWRSYSGSLRHVVLQSDGHALLSGLLKQALPVLLQHGLHDRLARPEALSAVVTEGDHQATVQWFDAAHDIVFTHTQALADGIGQWLDQQLDAPD